MCGLRGITLSLSTFVRYRRRPSCAGHVTGLKRTADKWSDPAKWRIIKYSEVIRIFINNNGEFSRWKYSALLHHFSFYYRLSNQVLIWQQNSALMCFPPYFVQAAHYSPVPRHRCIWRTPVAQSRANEVVRRVNRSSGVRHPDKWSPTKYSTVVACFLK